MAGELRDEQWHAHNDVCIRAIADSSLVAIGRRRQTHPASGDSQSCNHASSLPHDLAPLALDALFESEVEDLLHADAELRGALDIFRADFARDRAALLALALALGLLALLSLRTTSLTRGEPLSVEAALARLLHATTALWALTNTDACTDVLDTNIAAIRLVCIFRGSRSCTLAERRSRRGRRTLAEAHESLHALRAAAV